MSDPQGDMFPPETPWWKRGKFDGPDVTETDADRLTGQGQRVYNVMKGGEWHSLREIADATGDPEASISARLRDLRKDRFGSHSVERRRRTQGTWEYRLYA